MDPAAGPRGEAVIALTGGTGFLGSHIADALLQEGFGVRAAVRPTSDRRWLAGRGIDCVQVDLAQEQDCLRLVRGTRGLIHCAGLVAADGEDAYRRANVLSTQNLLNACAAAWPAAGPAADPSAGPAAPAFVLISSLAAHGPAPLDRPAREDDPCRPIGAYGRSKAAAEEAVGRGWPFRCAILRPPALYGPRDRSFLPLLKAARRGWTVRIAGPLQGLSLVEGSDAARAAVALLTCPAAAGPYFVDDGRAGYDWRALAQALTAACGRRVRTLSVPAALLTAVAALRPARAGGGAALRGDRLRDLRAAGWACDGSRLRAATGFAARFGAAAGFARTLAFYEEQRWL